MFKGPLQLIKKHWLHDEWIGKLKKPNLIEFVLGLRERIRKAMLCVNESEFVGKSKSKHYYDLTARAVGFEVGEKVLVLLPLRGKPLLAKYSGPYVVTKRLNEVDYVISTPDRRKSSRVVHVNLLKRFVSREVDENDAVAELSLNVISEVEVSQDVHDAYSNINKLDFAHLDDLKTVHLRKILLGYA